MPSITIYLTEVLYSKVLQRALKIENLSKVIQEALESHLDSLNGVTFCHTTSNKTEGIPKPKE